MHNPVFASTLIRSSTNINFFQVSIEYSFHLIIVVNWPVVKGFPNLPFHHLIKGFPNLLHDSLADTLITWLTVFAPVNNF